MSFSNEEKAMWLEDWRKSGKNAWAYAKENGLIPQTFSSWVKKETKQAAGFVEIQPKPVPLLQGNKILVEKGEVRIHIPLGLSNEELRLVLESIRVSL